MPLNLMEPCLRASMRPSLNPESERPKIPTKPKPQVGSLQEFLSDGSMLKEVAEPENLRAKERNRQAASKRAALPEDAQDLEGSSGLLGFRGLKGTFKGTSKGSLSYGTLKG